MLNAQRARREAFRVKVIQENQGLHVEERIDFLVGVLGLADLVVAKGDVLECLDVWVPLLELYLQSLEVISSLNGRRLFVDVAQQLRQGCDAFELQICIAALPRASPLVYQTLNVNSVDRKQLDDVEPLRLARSLLLLAEAAQRSLDDLTWLVLLRLSCQGSREVLFYEARLVEGSLVR